MMLTESEVLSVDEQLIRIGESLYQKVIRIESLTEVQKFLKKKLGENRVYVAVRMDKSYEIYQQAVLAEPTILAPCNAPTKQEVVSMAEVNESEILYYRGQPYTRH